MPRHNYTVVLTMDGVGAFTPVQAAKTAREWMLYSLAEGRDPVFDVYEGDYEPPQRGDDHTRVHGDTDEMCRTTGCAEIYSEDGDGNSGFCPSCADKLFVLEENGVDIGGEPVSDYDRISVDLTTLDALYAQVGEN